MIHVTRMIIASITIAGISITALYAQDFTHEPILPIVPEITPRDSQSIRKPSASSDVQRNDIALETIKLPAAQDENDTASPSTPELETIPFPDTTQPALPNVTSAADVNEPASNEIAAPDVPELTAPSSSPSLAATHDAPSPAQPKLANAPTPQDIEPAQPESIAMPEVAPIENESSDQTSAPQNQAAASPASEETDVKQEPSTPTIAADPESNPPSESPQTAASLPTTQTSGEPSPDQISLGDFGVSLMFSPEDINTLSQVLQVYEIRKSTQVAGESAQGSDSDLLAELLRAANGDEPLPEGSELEEEQLPAFYLGSIVFNHKGDWSLWINQQRASPRKRDIAALGISVRGVNTEYATIAWKPENLTFARARWQEAKEIDPTAPREWKHREVRGARIDFDEDKGEFIVTLRANQTFYTNSMQIFEGRRTIEVAAGNVQQAQTDAAATPQTPGVLDGQTPSQGNSNNPAAALQAIPQNNAGGVGKEREAANTLINNLKGAAGALSGLQGESSNAQPSSTAQ